MIRNYIIICFLGLAVFSSCHQAFNERNDYREVMKVHDIAMAEMGTMHNFEKQLKKLKLETRDSIELLSINQAILLLNKADDGMMEWMRQFSKPDNEAEFKNYLSSEMKKVTVVNKNIVSAIEQAELIIEKHENK